MAQRKTKQLIRCQILMYFRRKRALRRSLHNWDRFSSENNWLRKKICAKFAQSF